MQENIAKRLKELRKQLDLTQEEFAKKIGLSRANVGNIEYGRVLLTDRNIITICQTFNVNEDWLRNGNEPIFKEKSNDILEEFLKEYNLSEFMSDIVRRYLNLELEYQHMFEKFVKEMVKDLNVDKNTENDKIKEFPKQEKEERVQIIARGEGITEISKEEFEELKRNSVRLDPEDYDKYF